MRFDDQIIASNHRENTNGEQTLYDHGSVPYFNEVAAQYFAKYNEQSPGGYAFCVRKKRVLELLNGVKGKVLDVGCGPGVMVEELTNWGCEVWALDAAPQMVEQCYQNFGRLPNVHCVVGNAIRLNYPEESFDAVICLGVIDRIEEYETAIKEMLRVLKIGGTLLISFPNLYSPYCWWRKFIFNPLVDLLRPVYYRLTSRSQPPALISFVKLYTVANTAQLMTKYAGELTDVVHFNFNIFLPPFDQLFSRSAMWVAQKLEARRFGKLKWLGTGFILKAKKRKHN